MKLTPLIAAVLAVSISALPHKARDDVVCLGYDSCPATDDKKINVHLIPHSHDDVGWLNTVDEYYYNTVQSIIGSVIAGLKEDSSRRFIQVETAYFKMWLRDQDESVRQDVTDLINEGRLEIINGAWSMNDEAASHYQSTVDQFTLGLRYLQDNLGKCARPKISWQIDPFGHSREQASLSTQFGFDGFYFARLDYRDKDKRKKDKTMDMLWTGSANLGSGSNIFTSALYNHYSTPASFCFDIRCNDPVIVMDEESPEYNWEQRVQDFAKVIQDQSQYYEFNNILITLGDDFKWEAALTSYVNYDKLIKGFAKFNPKVGDKEVNIFYSTPSCYVKAVNDHVNRNNLKLNVKTDDFFPYASSSNRVWSGFYTSRATSKRFERQSNNLLQVSKQLKAIADTAQTSTQSLEEQIGVMQHHDAITGTEKTHVEKEYHRALTKAVETVVKADNDALSKILNADDLGLQSCLLANVSICSSSNQDKFNLVLYNPLARTVSQTVQVPVQDGTWEVTGPDGKTIESTLTNPIGDFEFIAENLTETSLPKVLFFRATNIPAVGYNVYTLKKTSSKLFEPEVRKVKALDQIGFTSNYINFDDNGNLKSITIKNNTMNVSQKLMYYVSKESGAYIFRPTTEVRDAQDFKGAVESTYHTSSGNVVREVRQAFSDWAVQIIRIYPDEDFVEFDYLIGPIDLGDTEGTEIISRFTTDLATKGEFYTDSNGREMIYRKKDYRPTYDYSTEEPQAGNYYPVTSNIVLKDGSREFSVLNDRAQGGSSLNNGQVEVMLHRAMLHDDGFGVGENLNEEAYGRGLMVRATHYVTLGKSDTSNSNGKTSAATQRDIAQKKLLAPWPLYTTKDLSSKSQSFLNKELPENIHLLTLDKWDDSTYLIRLEHILEKNEDSNLSVDTTVDLTDLFTTFKINSLKEYNLAANIPLDEVSRLQWPQLENVKEEGPLSKEWRLSRAVDDLKITLAPMQIITLKADITRK